MPLQGPSHEGVICKLVDRPPREPPTVTESTTVTLKQVDVSETLTVYTPGQRLVAVALVTPPGCQRNENAVESQLLFTLTVALPVHVQGAAATEVTETSG